MVNTVLRTECACPGCEVEVPSLNQSLDEASVQSLTKKVNGSDARPKPQTQTRLREEVAESSSFPLEGVPSLLGPHPSTSNKTSGLVNINNMQLVPFTGTSAYDHAARSSRFVDYSPTKKRGTATPYLDALKSNLGLPKLCITPLKINSFIPLIPNYIPHEPHNRLSIVPHQKQATPNALNDLIQESILPLVPEKKTKLDDKPKRKQKSIEEILGLSKPIKSKKGCKRGKKRCVVFRSAMAAAALSVSTEGITNRNRILLSESKAAWSITKILETDYMGDDEEVLSRIMVTDEEVELRAVLLNQSNEQIPNLC